MDESQFFDSNIERAVNIMATLSQSGEKKDNMEFLTAMLPLVVPAAEEKLKPLIKALNVNKILQNYMMLSKQNAHLTERRKAAIADLRGELDAHGQKLLELFVKFNEIRDIMEVI